jgi:hypothetical protein
MTKTGLVIRLARTDWIQEGVRVAGRNGRAWAGLSGTVSHVVSIRGSKVERVVVVWDSFADKRAYSQNVPADALNPLHGA